MTYFLKKYEDINMIKVNDKSKLNYYIKKFAINEIFTENIEDNIKGNKQEKTKPIIFIFL